MDTKIGVTRLGFFAAGCPAAPLAGGRANDAAAEVIVAEVIPPERSARLGHSLLVAPAVCGKIASSLTSPKPVVAEGTVGGQNTELFGGLDSWAGAGAARAVFVAGTEMADDGESSAPSAAVVDSTASAFTASTVDDVATPTVPTQASGATSVREPASCKACVATAGAGVAAGAIGATEGGETAALAGGVAAGEIAAGVTTGATAGVGAALGSIHSGQRSLGKGVPSARSDCRRRSVQ